ncbi:hypothetical protein F5Y04DRAFT_60677 [Hypomontagnella monticulosa]|nr:hypothetical protein F5Y04DRAFT_60677 [Hypomontagnella monticulosa]
MDSLPGEILLHILSNVDSSLASCASASRRCQWYAEIITFASIRLDSSEDCLKTFGRVFAYPRRRCLLKELIFEVEAPGKFRGKVADRKRFHNKHFSNAINGLFTQLYEWNSTFQGSKRAPSVNLTIVPKSPWSYAILDDDRRSRKHVKLDNIVSLPSVTCVKKFKSVELNIHPRAAVAIYRALPCMQHLVWKLNHVPPRRLEVARTAMRQSIASALLDVEFSSLEVLDFCYPDHDPKNHMRTPENLLDMYGNDGLSLAVNRLLKLPKLRRLNLQGLALSPQVFRLDDKSQNLSTTLEHIELSVPMSTPAGSWYFTGDNLSAAFKDHYGRLLQSNYFNIITDKESQYRTQDGDLPRVEFRCSPEPTMIDPFLVAMGRAVVGMPALKEACCIFPDVARIAYYPSGRDGPHVTTAEQAVLPMSVTYGRWMIKFHKEQCIGKDATWPTDWEIPEELVELLRATGNSVLLTRGRRARVYEPARVRDLCLDQKEGDGRPQK